KIHPRDQMQTRTLLARADRLYEQSLGDRRQFLSQVIARYQAVVETQDSHLIRKEHVQLSQWLDEIEQESML
ncbi:molecular chaperone HscC, partial [Acinetobacter baumannii]